LDDLAIEIGAALNQDDAVAYHKHHPPDEQHEDDGPVQTAIKAPTQAIHLRKHPLPIAGFGRR
jgi:hypothetical protein